MNTIAMMRNTMDILKIQPQIDILAVEERRLYLEAFMAFDKKNNGVISNKNLIHALRRVGLNPTEVVNYVDNANNCTVQFRLKSMKSSTKLTMGQK